MRVNLDSSTLTSQATPDMPGVQGGTGLFKDANQIWFTKLGRLTSEIGNCKFLTSCIQQTLKGRSRLLKRFSRDCPF